MCLKKLVLCLFVFFIFTLQAYESEYKIKKIEFKGNHSFSSKQLNKQISAKDPSFLSKINIFKKIKPVPLVQFQKDLKALVYFYQANGFLKVQITQSFEKTKKNYTLTYVIIENDQIIIDSVKVKIIAPVGIVSDITEADSIYYSNQINKMVQSNLKADYSDELVKTTILSLKNYLSENSFIKNQITPSFLVNSDSSKVNVVYDINTGKHYLINNIEIVGLKYLSEKPVRFQIPFPDSFTYNTKRIDIIKNQLNQLDQFKQISIETHPEESDTYRIPLYIYLKEKPKQQFKTGVGYGLEDKYRIMAEYNRMNFGGNARHLQMIFKSNALEPWNLSLNLREPLPIRHSLYGMVNPYWVYQKENIYRLIRVGTFLGINQTINLHNNYQINYQLEQNNLLSANVFESDSLVSIYNKSAINTNYTFTDLNKNDHGVTSSLNTTYSTRILNSTYHYFRWILDNRLYYPLSTSNTLALKFKYGQIYSFNKDKIIPVEERFYAGGSNSIRGWLRNEISPVQNNEKTGGNSLLECSLENRLIFYPQFEWAVFYDFGNVWKTNHEFDHILSSCGTGIRYNSIIGTIRFDVATPVFQKEHPIQYYLQIGNSF